jgi:hypothetical protein
MKIRGRLMGEVFFCSYIIGLTSGLVGICFGEGMKFFGICLTGLEKRSTI